MSQHSHKWSFALWRCDHCLRNKLDLEQDFVTKLWACNPCQQKVSDSEGAEVVQAPRIEYQERVARPTEEDTTNPIQKIIEEEWTIVEEDLT